MKDKKHGLSTFKEEDKLVLHNVIGGLEKKKYGLDFGVFKGEKEGHNQLCNREVEMIENKLFDIIDGFAWNGMSYKQLSKAISTALSKGQLLKVKE